METRCREVLDFTGVTEENEQKCKDLRLKTVNRT